MTSKNYNASNNWTYNVRQTVDWLSLSMIVDPDPYKAAREVIERIKAL
jgi:hypothetical protein